MRHATFGAFLLTVVVSAVWLVVPAYEVHSPGKVAGARLADVNGIIRTLTVISVPVIICGIAVVWCRSIPWMAALLWMFAILGSGSIGLFYYPSAAVLTWTAISNRSANSRRRPEQHAAPKT